MDLKVEGPGKHGKVEWILEETKEEVIELTKEERRKQSHEKKIRAKKHKSTHGGCRGFLGEED